ncbi:MAG: hypothetical protein WD991_01405 [Candidatus Paceibacterota bacterium]
MKKNVTDRQGLEHARLARAKKVSREAYQTVHDDGTMARVLDGIRDGLPITVGVPVVPPPGCRILTLKVPVRLDEPWDDAVNAAGPDTGADWNVRKVGDLYVPTGKGVVEQEFVLLNYPAGDGSWEKAITWGDTMHLHRTAPRQVFAIGKAKPNFHTEVGIDPTYVVETTGCAFDGDGQACFVWWDGSRREAYLNWQSLYGSSHVWFAFRK